MIAFDRYIATNYPIHYLHHRHSILLALSNIFIAWFVSLCICLLPTLFFEKNLKIYSKIENKTISISTTKYNELTRQCELYKDLNFVVTSSLLSFYIPLIIMIFLYTKVLYAIKQQSLFRSKKNNKSTTNDEEFNRYFYSDNSLKCQPNELSSSDQHQLRHREITAEFRITRSLAIVIGCFICCWLPFFTLYIIRAVCLCLSFNAIEFFVWLGYSNSSINPVLYAILNKNFRLAFKKKISGEK
jgi:dopamine receptor D5